MICTCYITDLETKKSFFDDVKFSDFKDLGNYIGLMEENNFRVDRVVRYDDVILYDILEPERLQTPTRL